MHAAIHYREESQTVSIVLVLKEVSFLTVTGLLLSVRSRLSHLLQSFNNTRRVLPGLQGMKHVNLTLNTFPKP